MKSLVLLPISEEQVMALVQQLTPDGKRQLIRTLLTELDTPDWLVDFDDQRMRTISASRNIDWDSLSDDDRMRLLDEML